MSPDSPAHPARVRQLSLSLPETPPADARISAEQWHCYHQDGYLRLGKLLADDELEALRRRIDDIMLGKADLDYDKVLMQLDGEGGMDGQPRAMSRGHKGATLDYRKIQNLEYDKLFLQYMERPIFREICIHEYGHAVPIAAFRAMFMNKPAGKGTFLPWHQDRWCTLDRDPVVTVWTALDPSTVANGCVQIVPGSHKRGLINPSHPSGFLTKEQTESLVTPEAIVHLEVEAGEAVLLHNWLLHASDVNKTNISRRAFSVCYMDGRTKASNAEKFSAIFENV
jgi:phytanoyl-CoA hydroxylase